MQDFDRGTDKNKETSKATKHLTKLFPNKVTIQPPKVCSIHTSKKGQLTCSSFSDFFFLFFKSGKNVTG
jgi:hypothetical protein